MSKTKRPRVELRYYDIPHGDSVLALLGDSWKRNYGNDTTCQHFHNLTEIGFCRYGAGALQDGEDSVCPYSAGTFTVFPANFPHNTLSATLTQIDFWEYLFLDAPRLVQELYQDDPLAADNLLHRLRRAPHVFSAAQEPELAAAIQAVMEERRQPGRDFSREITRAMVRSLLFRIARTAPPGEDAQAVWEGGELQIHAALAYVAKHYAEPIRIEALADACHLSETHFRRVFFEAMNMTPLDFINLERIQRACEQMQKTGDSMEVIAAHTGFATQSSFNRTFLKLVGTTPYHWKKKNDHCEANRVQFHITAKEGWF